MIYQDECANCGKKIDREEGGFVVNTKTGEYFCSEECMDEK